MKIGTHNGEFHADDLFAVATLFTFNDKAEVVRTRDPQVLATCDVVVDVGGVYDPATSRFDHHQIQGAPAPRPNGLLYSSFGLVWLRYGEQLAGSFDAARIVERDLVQGIDALDNMQGSTEVLPEVEHATISGLIAAMNPTWVEIQRGSEYDYHFHNALDVARTILHRHILAAQAEAKMLRSFERLSADICINSFKGMDASAGVLALADSDPEVKFLVFLAGSGEWSVQAVPPTRSRKQAQRCPFPKEWGNLRGADLAAVTGVADAIFCHKFQFFACAASREGAIALAKLALSKG